MRQVAILGVGQLPVREHWDMSIRAMAVEACRAAMVDADVERVDSIYVGNMTSGSLNQQRQLGALVADFLGQWGVEAVKLEAACGSAGSALRQGIIAVAAGAADRVLAVGVEKMTETGGHTTTSALVGAADAEYEAEHGVTFVGLNALVMRRYMHEYGYQQADFAPFALNAHANGAKNPYAMFRDPISEKAYRRGRIVADPISLYDASPIGDGAAALLLVPAEHAPAAVRIIGSAVATDTLSIHDRHDPLWLSAAEQSAARAFQQAGIGPEDRKSVV